MRARTPGDRRADDAVQAALRRTDQVDTRLWTDISAGRTAQAVKLLRSESEHANDELIQQLNLYQRPLQTEEKHLTEQARSTAWTSAALVLGLGVFAIAPPAASIAELIEHIQAETRVTVQTVEADGRRIDRGADVVEQTREAFTLIGWFVDDVTTRIDHIAEATAGVLAVTEQSSATAQEASVAVTAVSAQELARLAERLDAAVSRFPVA